MCRGDNIIKDTFKIIFQNFGHYFIGDVAKADVAIVRDELEVLCLRNESYISGIPLMKTVVVIHNNHALLHCFNRAGKPWVLRALVRNIY